MSSLFEVVFEDVVKNNALRLFLTLIAEAEKVINVECTEDIKLIVAGELDLKALNSVFDFDDDVTIIVNLDGMKAGGLSLPKVLLRLVKYGGHYDVDFNFDINELENGIVTSLVTELHDHIKGLARNNGVGAFFGGMEPASHEETRYFTNNHLGPLMILPRNSRYSAKRLV